MIISNRSMDKHKKHFSIIMVVVLLLQIFTMSITPMKGHAFSAEGKVTYQGSAKHDETIVGKFLVDGEIAFCLDHAKLTPPTGYDMSQGSVYNNESIKAVLYYGYGGPGNVVGTSDEAIVATSMALNHFMNGDTGISQQNKRFTKLLIQHGENKDAPISDVEFSNSSLNSSVSGNVQKSQTTTFKADSKNSITIKVPAEVTLVNETTGQKVTANSAIVKGGEKIHFEAGLGYGKDFDSGKLEPAMGAYQSIIFLPEGANSNNYQRLGQGKVVKDPSQTVQLKVNFQAREGWLEVSKLGNDTNKLLSGATFQVKDGNKVVDTITTGSNGKAKSKALLPNKTYSVTETKAPKGYTINTSSKTVKVNAGETSGVSFTNEAVLGEIEITKSNDDGDVVEGVEYDVKDSSGKVVGEIVTGKEGKAKTKKLPLGKYELVETFVPKPLAIDRTPIKVELTYKDQNTALVSTSTKQENKIVKGEVEIGKVDYKTQQGVDGATYGLYDSDDKLIQESTTKDGGVAYFKDVRLGVYYIKEIKAPEGYQLDKQEYFANIKYKDMDTPIIKIELGDELQQRREPSIGTTASFAGLDKQNPNITTLTDVVEYQDLVAEKEYILEGVLMDKYTGKPVLVDGKEITTKKTFTTKSIDGEVKLEFIFDQSKINTDTIVVYEKLFTENKDGNIIEVANHEDINDVDQTVEIPKVQTEASFVELDKEDPKMTTLVDVVKYENLIIGEKYTVNGKLMDKETGKPIIIDDKEVTGSTTFKPTKANGNVEVEFVFDQTKLKTDTVVVFEDLYNDKMLVAVHHDINDKEQTVEIPKVETEASFVELDKEDPKMTTLVDVVKYENLIVGEEYTVNGKLMDKETGKPIIIDEKEVKGSTTFKPTKANGKVEVEFTFDQTKLKTDTVVVFEDLYAGDRLIAVHHDINDKEQTVEIPNVGTTASFVKIEKENPDIATLVDIVKYENLIVGEEYTVSGILMDKETGEPIEIEDNDIPLVPLEPSIPSDSDIPLTPLEPSTPVEDNEGKEEEVKTKHITGETTFVAESANAQVEVEFTFDKSKLKTDTVVVFEDLHAGERLIAVHHDINDIEQTVEIPKVETEASFVELDKKDPNITTLVDIVHYEGLVVGKEYTVNGHLMNKETEEPILNDGEKIAGSTTFVAKESKGNVEVEFVFDQTKLETDTVVVFEDLYDGENLIAVHHDINDEEQTVEIPKVQTEASFVGLDKENPNITTLVDVVYYDNLLVGEEYTVNGVLMDKETSEPIIIDDKQVTGSTTFVAKATEGNVEVEFTFDQTKLKTDTVVVFEDLYNGERLIAVHHDINDVEQTVEIPKVETEASFVERDTDKTDMITLADEVTYDNLIVGKEYTVNGKLMDKETGKPIIIDGKEVTGTTTFIAKKSVGKVEVLFTFDQSKLKAESVVVFEDLYDGEKLVAVHHDINDKDQTVDMVKVEIIKTDSKDGKRLEGAEFTMYSKKGKHVLDVQVTDKNGLAYFNIVEGEEVVINETKAPDGYKINKKQSKNKVKGEGKLITLEIENDRIPEKPLPNDKTSDNALPKTATAIFNLLLIGFVLTLIGGGVVLYNGRKATRDLD